MSNPSEPRQNPVKTPSEPRQNRQNPVKTPSEPSEPSKPQFFYVTALEGERAFFMAGPYEDHESALNRVEPVRKIACDFERNTNAGRAAFMAYGTTGMTERRATSLGVI